MGGAKKNLSFRWEKTPEASRRKVIEGWLADAVMEEERGWRKGIGKTCTRGHEGYWRSGGKTDVRKMVGRGRARSTYRMEGLNVSLRRGGREMLGKR